MQDQVRNSKAQQTESHEHEGLGVSAFESAPPARTIPDGREQPSQLKGIQAAADRSPQVAQLMAYQETANQGLAHRNAMQLKASSEGEEDFMFGEEVPVQMQAEPGFADAGDEEQEIDDLENEEDDAIQMKTAAPVQLMADESADLEEEDENDNAETAQLVADESADLEEEDENDDAETTQLKAEGSGGAKPVELDGMHSSGLPMQLKAGMEQLSGVDLSDVNVHYNSDQPMQLQAHAYAQGTDIHVAPGQEQHLPHEAWHVVQQKQGRVQPTTQLKSVGINDDVGLEKEADVMGAKAMDMGAQMKTSANSTDALASSTKGPEPPAQMKLASGTAPIQMVKVKWYSGPVPDGWELIEKSKLYRIYEDHGVLPHKNTHYEVMVDLDEDNDSEMSDVEYNDSSSKKKKKKKYGGGMDSIPESSSIGSTVKYYAVGRRVKKIPDHFEFICEDGGTKSNIYKDTSGLKQRFQEVSESYVDAITMNDSSLRKSTKKQKFENDSNYNHENHNFNTRHQKERKKKMSEFMDGKNDFKPSKVKWPESSWVKCEESGNKFFTGFKRPAWAGGFQNYYWNTVIGAQVDISGNTVYPCQSELGATQLPRMSNPLYNDICTIGHKVQWRDYLVKNASWKPFTYKGHRFRGIRQDDFYACYQDLGNLEAQAQKYNSKLAKAYNSDGLVPEPIMGDL